MYYTPSPLPPHLEKEETSSKSHWGLVALVCLILFIIIIGIVISRSNTHQEIYEPHVIHVPPTEAAIATGQSALQLSYPTNAPYAIAPNAECVPGSNWFPSCIYQVPVQPFATGDKFCVAGSPYFPICRITQSFPLPSYDF